MTRMWGGVKKCGARQDDPVNVFFHDEGHTRASSFDPQHIEGKVKIPFTTVAGTPSLRDDKNGSAKRAAPVPGIPHPLQHPHIPHFIHLPIIDIKVKLEAIRNPPIANLLCHIITLTPISQGQVIANAVVVSRRVCHVAEVLDAKLDLDGRAPLDRVRFGVWQDAAIASIDGDLVTVLCGVPITVTAITNGAAAEIIFVTVDLSVIYTGALAGACVVFLC
ncbi:hypothetical protein EJ02DRAFT_508271 [Clathrospora elynae]|uniref:Uncharacterized protein n=1 Tax=Clathrospora elynae TaxID=706981 RepID=A0A6A5T2B2_9PLEO|nr:hypothetical protein EJ02DRAFT_508271 [Clathrospora elynae]